MDPRSAYVHIPFCHRRCFYCDFPVVPLGDRADGATSGSIAAYLALLHQEIATSPGGPPLATVYLGGGTPSMLSSVQVAAILEALASRFGLASGAELSLELDPASFDEARLAGYLAAGINRVSLGARALTTPCWRTWAAATGGRPAGGGWLVAPGPPAGSWPAGAWI